MKALLRKFDPIAIFDQSGSPTTSEEKTTLFIEFIENR